MIHNKDTKGKNRMDLVPPEFIEDVAKVFTHGCDKYGDNTFYSGIHYSKLIGAIKRHLSEFEKCNDFDDETGLKHIAHASANLAMLSVFTSYDEFHKFDDRINRSNFKKVSDDIDFKFSEEELSTMTGKVKIDDGFTIGASNVKIEDERKTHDNFYCVHDRDVINSELRNEDSRFDYKILSKCENNPKYCACEICEKNRDVFEDCDGKCGYDCV